MIWVAVFPTLTVLNLLLGDVLHVTPEQGRDVLDPHSLALEAVAGGGATARA